MVSRFEHAIGSRAFFPAAVFTVLILSFLSSPLQAATTSCDLGISPSSVNPSDYGANPGRITVFGQADGSGFDDNTYVQINCDAGGVLPAPVQALVRATRNAYSYGQYQFSGYCTYPVPSTDTSYQVSATVMPDGFPCTGASGTVLVKGAPGSAPAPAPTPVPSPAPVPSPVSGPPLRIPVPAPADPVPNSSAGNEQPPVFPGEEQSMTLTLASGWNMIGLPLDHISNFQSTCQAAYYSYDASSHAYAKLDSNWPLTLAPGIGVVAKAASACSITFSGTDSGSGSLRLSSGWNLVSPDTSAFLDMNNVQTDCNVLSGPWTYDRGAGRMVQASSFQPGTGYWIRAAGACSIVAVPNPNLPPAMPGPDTPAPSPQPAPPTGNTTPSPAPTPTPAPSPGYTPPSTGPGYVAPGSG